MRRETIGAIRLGTGRRRLVDATAALLWASGAAWLVAHYFLIRQGPYGPQTSPAEPWALRLHGLVAMIALALLGLLWGVHVVRGWRARRARWSGGALLAVAAVLGVTGYLLYYLGDETLRQGVSWLHWGLGLAALVVFVAHRVAPKR